ncbi:MAG: ATP-dependent RecD-like DNA helicase [Planctomycetes bacterium]|nr:ATP-dependent RecD-like DNA helicase [Planctomycetota bacterium]
MPDHPPKNAKNAHESLAGQVVAVIFQGEDTGFAVISMKVEDEGFVTAAGSLGSVHEGEFLRLHGKWAKHPKFGRQFQAQWSEHTSPTSLDGLEKYIGSGTFPGVGPDMAKRLVAHFGDRTLDALEGGTVNLQDVPGIGPKRAEALAEGFQEGRERHRVLAELRGFGLGGNHASALYERWQARAIERVQADPYALVGDLRGVGFQTADAIARTVGIPLDSAVRARGVLLHLLREAGREGHTCLPEMQVIEKLDQLGLGQESIVEGVQGAIQAGRVLLVSIDPTGNSVPSSFEEPSNAGKAFYLNELHESEAGLAEQVQRLLSPGDDALATPEQVLGAIERTAFRPDESQRLALEMALSAHLAVVTGGPGTGKTTTLRLLLEILAAAGSYEVKLASPTGRAAKRLQEATGFEASTIHRLLGFDPATGGFRHNEDEPLELDYLIVDEVSMMDVQLAHSLLQAVPDGARVLLVGDADQLPSVGPGAVLRDLVAVPTVPTTRLEQIHRQGAGSGITEAAHSILHGEMPQAATTPSGNGDFFLTLIDDAEQAADMTERIIAERIPEKYGFDAGRDLLLLSPMYRGPLGVDELNRRLSDRLNPDGEEVAWAAPLRTGDQVMVVRNDYDRETFNGDTGEVISIGKDKLIAEINGSPQHYSREDVKDLIPAYCVTVHRAQGSEARAVVIVLGNTHYPMLRRNLLYTAVTRGKELVVVVCSKSALRRAVTNDFERTRFGGLVARLA